MTTPPHVSEASVLAGSMGSSVVVSEPATVVSTPVVAILFLSPKSGFLALSDMTLKVMMVN